MTREELLEKVKGKLGGTKLTLSEKTVNEELDDMLDDFGDDEAANEKLVERIANRLKRMDGNLHTDVSAQVKDYKKKAKEREEKRKQKEREEADENTDDEEDDEEMPDEKKMPAWAKKMYAEMQAEREARKQKEAADAKNALLNSVKKGLKEKFAKAGLEANDFFVKTAIDRLEIPEENADVAALVGNAEKLYNEDTKAAGWTGGGKPRGGGGGGAGAVDEHEWDDVKALAGRRKPKADQE